MFFAPSTSGAEVPGVSTKLVSNPAYRSLAIIPVLCMTVLYPYPGYCYAAVHGRAWLCAVVLWPTVYACRTCTNAVVCMCTFRMAPLLFVVGSFVVFGGGGGLGVGDWSHVQGMHLSGKGNIEPWVSDELSNLPRWIPTFDVDPSLLNEDATDLVSMP